MKLRSIPPANRSRRRSLDHLSSMRAATHTGMIFVGPAMGREGKNTSAETPYTPQVIKANPAVRQAREDFQRAWAELIRQLETLTTEAASPEEATYWQRELEKMRR